MPSSFTPLRMVLTVMKAKRNGNASAFSVQRAVRHTPAEEQRSDLFSRCWVPYLFRLVGGFPGSPGNAIQSRVTSSHRVVLDSRREGLREFQRTLRKPNHIVAFLRHTERPITSRLGLRPALPQTFSDHPDCSGSSSTAQPDAGVSQVESLLLQHCSRRCSLHLSGFRSLGRVIYYIHLITTFGSSQSVLRLS